MRHPKGKLLHRAANDVFCPGFTKLRIKRAKPFLVDANLFGRPHL
jgi:hypothetical protein